MSSYLFCHVGKSRLFLTANLCFHSERVLIPMTDKQRLYHELKRTREFKTVGFNSSKNKNESGRDSPLALRAESRHASIFRDFHPMSLNFYVAIL